MRHHRSFIALSIPLILLLFLGIRSASSKDRFQQFTMNNGIKVILEENRAVPVVALQIWVKTGSADEKDEEAGVCHFIEHMLFKGTEKRKVREMAREIESLGGNINAYTSYDDTVYYVTLSSLYADTGLSILTDLVGHPTFDPSELEREREVILEEIRRGEDDPSRRLFNQTMAALYQQHPYRRPISGYERTVRAITRDQMVSFFKRWYVPTRMVFIASGDFDIDSMSRKIREALSEIRNFSEPLPERVEEPRQSEGRSVVSTGNLKETYFQIGFRIPSAKDEDAPALNGLAYILGGGEASRLVQKMKLEKGLVNAISASSLTPKDPGAFIINASLPADDLEKALAAVWEEVARIEREGVTKEELERFKVNAESGSVYDRQTAQGRARRLGNYEVVAGDALFESEYLRRIAHLRTQDIQRVAEEYLIASPCVVSILTSFEKADLVRSLSLPPMIGSGRPDGSLPARKIQAPGTQRMLDNGIRVNIKEDRSSPIVSLQASFLGGLRFEQTAQNGINNFLAVMLTKGSKGRSSLEITKRVEKMAGSLSAFSGYNSFGLTLTVLSQHFEEAFNLFAEILRQPSFDTGEMEKRRRLILASIRQQEDDLSRLVLRLFRKTLFGDHPYGMDVLGTPESVKKLTRKDLVEYYQKMVVPENMVLSVVGDVEEKQVVRAAEERFGDLRGGSRLYPSGMRGRLSQKVKKNEIHRTKEQAHFVLGFIGPGLQQDDRYAVEVLRAALSGQGGRLFRELRDKESLAYALDFFAALNLDVGYMGVYMGTHPSKLQTAIDGVVRELRRVKEEGLGEDEVERAKRYLIGSFKIALQTYQAQANQMSLDELYGLGFDHYRRYPQRIEKVSKEDVSRAARKYLNLEAAAMAIVRPPGEGKE